MQTENHQHKFKSDKFVPGFQICKCGIYRAYNLKTKVWEVFDNYGQKIGA